ncbi:MAG: hypothetical protein A2Y40_10900 [Candidatus Margulisbacteria bacterium GWF2_35_9]|nr:MAG: hypothetical protein A2Y40_10900 [Candidatus Margulisbacteria bacterium GWF2_35_9]
MSSIDLIILGELTEKEWSAYDLANFVIKQNIQEMANISSPAVYKNLLKLAKNGYLATRKEKVGNMPERKVYEITQKGLDFYKTLLLNNIDQTVNYRFDFNAVFYNLKRLEKTQAESLVDIFNKRLLDKKNLLEKAKTKMSKEKNSKCMCIIEQHELINNALLVWVSQCKERYINKLCK